MQREIGVCRICTVIRWPTGNCYMLTAAYATTTRKCGLTSLLLVIGGCVLIRDRSCLSVLLRAEFFMIKWSSLEVTFYVQCKLHSFQSPVILFVCLHDRLIQKNTTGRISRSDCFAPTKQHEWVSRSVSSTFKNMLSTFGQYSVSGRNMSKMAFWCEKTIKFY